MSGSHVFSKERVNGVYIPSALLLIGTAIIKREWLPFAVAVAGILGSWKIYNSQNSIQSPSITESHIVQGSGDQNLTVLDPKQYQEFMLKEKTPLSHNTAM
jgi:cytochrome-b5 reductase